MTAVTACVTAVRPQISTRVFNVGERHTITFLEPVDLDNMDGTRSPLHFAMDHMFEIKQFHTPQGKVRYRVSTRTYGYYVLDGSDTELLVWHWQPGPEFKGPDHPHIHVSASVTAREPGHIPPVTIGLDNLHIATSRVSIEAVIRTLINEFGVRPRFADWKIHLDRTEKRFRDTMTQRP